MSPNNRRSTQIYRTADDEEHYNMDILGQGLRAPKISSNIEPQKLAQLRGVNCHRRKDISVNSVSREELGRNVISI